MATRIPHRRTAIEGGLPCQRCGRRMQRYRHPTGWQPTPKLAYWFIFWDICKNSKCHLRVQHYDEAKMDWQKAEMLGLVTLDAKYELRLDGIRRP